MGNWEECIIFETKINNCKCLSRYKLIPANFGYCGYPGVLAVPKT